MSAIPTERKAQFLRKLFEILAQEPDGLRANEALERLGRAVSPTDYELGAYDSGAQRFEKIVRFTSITTVKAGWLVKSKGVWLITDAGREALRRYPVPEEFLKAARVLYWQWKKAQPKAAEVLSASAAELDEEESTEEASITFEKAEEQAWTDIENYLRKMPPYEFQKLVADLLRAMGYHVLWIAPPGKDGGIDILAACDPLGTHSPRIKVQVKRLNSTTSVDGLRAFLAVLGNNDAGLFVSTGGFTRDAEQEARAQENRKITLIDLEDLFDLWEEHYEKLTDTARQRLPLRRLYFLSPDN